MGILSYVSSCFSLSAFKVFSLSLTFNISNTRCLDVGLFGFILCGGLCAPWVWIFVSFAELGDFHCPLFLITVQFFWIIWSAVDFLLCIFAFQLLHSSVLIGSFFFLQFLPQVLIESKKFEEPLYDYYFELFSRTQLAFVLLSYFSGVVLVLLFGTYSFVSSLRLFVSMY